MQWDVNLGDVDPRRAGILARRAEQLGARGVWGGEITHSPFTLLTRIAETIRDRCEHIDRGSLYRPFRDEPDRAALLSSGGG